MLNKPALVAKERAQKERQKADRIASIFRVVEGVVVLASGLLMGGGIVAQVMLPTGISNEKPPVGVPVVVITSTGQFFKATADENGIFHDYCDGMTISNVTHFTQITNQ